MQLEQVAVDAPPPAGVMIVRDIDPYKSMITGEMIGGRRQHREHLRQHNRIEVGNEIVPLRKPEHPPVAPDLRAVLNERRGR